MCQYHQVYTTMCKCVRIFTIIFKELATQLAPPLDPNMYAKLDRSSGTRWPILPLLIVQSSILNPVINFSTHLWLVKWNALGYIFTLRIPFHLLRYWCNTCTNMINNDMIYSISSREHIGSSILTSLALYRCFGPSASSHHSTCPSHLQPVRRAKSCLDLLHFDHMTQYHVSCAMSSFITCVSFATSLSHLHCHGICCSHTCTCGLITCVSHSNTY
jgi:hypothetical protein